MFTINQIKEAHSKVRTGAEFPMYIQSLRRLGIRHYTTYVSDGHTLFSGKDNYQLQSEAKYTMLQIADKINGVEFRQYLERHQQGHSSYATFCEQAAATGIEKWEVIIDEMTCTYYDKAGNKVLVETIPAPAVSQ